MKRNACYLLCIMVLFVPLLLSVRAVGQEPYALVLKWSYGTFCGDWFPQGLAFGIAVDSKDNIFVVDTCGMLIKKYDKIGNFLLQWSPVPVDGHPLIPKAIAIDKNDHVYISANSDLMNSAITRVQKFDVNGNLLLQWGETGVSIPYNFGAAGGIACDSLGFVYVVAEFGDPVVCKFDAAGIFISGFGHWGLNTDGPDSFDYPTYIAVNSAGEIFVSAFGEEPDPCMIKKFDAQYNYLTSWIPPDAHGPNGLVIDFEGNLLVCTHDGRLIKFDPSGNLIQVIASWGTFDGHPGGVAIDSEGFVYVADESHNISKFAPPFVPYTFDGFFSPIENAPFVNQAKAGQAIPVKWRITDKNGLPISDPASFVSLTSFSVNCDTFEGELTNPVEEVAAGSSGLQYLGDGWWQYNWKTPKSYASQCRIMRLTLDDKSEHTASFKFK